MKVNKRALADILGVSERAITSWQDDGMPIATAGKRGTSNEYETSDVIAWRVKTLVARTSDESPKDRLARVQADRVEIDIAEKLGRLVPVESIEPMWAGYVTAARQKLRAEPPRLAHLMDITPGVEPKRELLAKIFDDFLSTLAGLGEQIDVDPAGDADQDDKEDSPPAKIKRRRVGRKV